MNEIAFVIILIFVGNLGVEFIKGFYRVWRLIKYGPSEKEFVRAMEIITLFINHHNRETPNGQIKNITISATGDMESKLSEAHE